MRATIVASAEYCEIVRRTSLPLASLCIFMRLQLGCASWSYNDECALDRELDGRFAHTYSSYAFRRHTFAKKGTPRYAMKIINR